MKGKRRNIIKWVVKAVLILLTISYLLSCLTPYIDPKYGAIWTMLSLSFPILFLLMTMVSFLLLIFRRKLFLINLFIIALGFKNINSCFAYQFFTSSKIEGGYKMKILSWNVDDFIYELQPSLADKKKRLKMLLFIKNTNADIICLQDNAFCFEPKLPNDVKDIQTMGYPYYKLSEDYYSRGKNTRKYGTAIFSKYPILSSDTINYKGVNYESLLYADIKIKNRVVRVFTTHLRSMLLHYQKYFSGEDYGMLQEDTSNIFEKSTLHKLIYFDQKHTEQSMVARQVMDTTKLPFIFCGDLNSVPSSFVYHHLSKGLKDAFLAKGKGLGNTYSELSPTLRIDVMFTTPDIEVVNYQTPKLALSDHYPIIVDLNIPQLNN